MAKLIKIEMYVVPMNIKEESMKNRQDVINTIKYDSLTEDALLHFGDISIKDIGEWDDDCKFNFDTTRTEEYRKEFVNEVAGEQ